MPGTPTSRACDSCRKRRKRVCVERNNSYPSLLRAGLAHSVTVRPGSTYMFKMPETWHTLCWRRPAALYFQDARREQVGQVQSTGFSNLTNAKQPCNGSEHVTRQQNPEPAFEIRD